jgi:hypothetical protein
MSKVEKSCFVILTPPRSIIKLQGKENDSTAAEKTIQKKKPNFLMAPPPTNTCHTKRFRIFSSTMYSIELFLDIFGK